MLSFLRSALQPKRNAENAHPNDKTQTQFENYDDEYAFQQTAANLPVSMPPLPRPRKQVHGKMRANAKLGESRDAHKYYGIVNMLNHGTFGEVFLCRIKPMRMQSSSSSAAAKKRQQQRVVAKVTSDHSHRNVFLTELALLRMFPHKNIVRMKEAFQYGDKLWLIMEYMDGGDLRRLCSLPGKWTEPMLAYVMKQVLEALNFLHQNHVVHRDIKPDNILWDSNGNVKVADLGIGNIITLEQDKLKGNAGTRGYRAPEILASRPYDCKVDIWSLGITALELIEGRKQTWWDWEPKTRAEAADAEREARRSEDYFEDFASRTFECFITSMLHERPTKRGMASQLLKHRFIDIHHDTTRMRPSATSHDSTGSSGSTGSGASWVLFGGFSSASARATRIRKDEFARFATGEIAAAGNHASWRKKA